jgi:hypothetical protein
MEAKKDNYGYPDIKYEDYPLCPRCDRKIGVIQYRSIIMHRESSSGTQEYWFYCSWCKQVVEEIQVIENEIHRCRI